MSNSLMCFNCHTPLGARLTRSFLEVHYAKCLSCGQANNANNVEVAILPTSLKLRNSNSAREATWWHGTIAGGWGEWISSTPIHPNARYVHVGTYPASLARRSAFTESHDWHIFKVKLKPGVEIADSIESDSYFNKTKGKPGVAQRYLNIWESPGSISMSVARDDLELIDHRVLPAGSWSARVAA